MMISSHHFKNTVCGGIIASRIGGYKYYGKEYV